MPGTVRRSVAAIGVIAALMLTGCTAAPGGRTEDSPSITAKGVGRVTGVPDVVVVTIGVETQSAQAEEALSGNNEKTTALINLLKQAGVAEEDLKTSQFSINPRYDDEGRAISGYTVTNLLTARVREGRDPGALIDAAAGAAGNDVRVQSVQFEIDDEGTLFAEARADAVRQARTQAEQLADAAGVELGDVRSITESSTEGSPPQPLLLPRTDAAQSVPLQPGSQELTLEVQVIYDIG
ncbi:MAG: SIMPL domain-containing protein [Actinomycetota bacterium]